MNIQDYGYTGNENLNNGLVVARVTAGHRDRYEIFCNKGTANAIIKRGEYWDNPNAIYPTVGDFVSIEWNEMGESRIINTLERKSCFTRLDPSPDGKREQFIAANFDFVFIMQSMNDNFSLRRLERYLTLAWQSGATPVVILTKCDLQDNFMSYVYEAEGVAIGVEVLPISTKTGYGIDKLDTYLKPGISVVFLGSSGVGKSTLVNTLAKKEVMEISDIRETDSKGRHTTTLRELIMLPNGAMVIDTPGMRELGMWDVTEGLDKTFKDVEQHIGKCKYTNCTHTNEPGCAIISAIENGELSKERFEAYIKLKNEARYSENSESYLVEKRNKFRAIAKQNRKNLKK